MTYINITYQLILYIFSTRISGVTTINAPIYNRLLNTNARMVMAIVFVIKTLKKLFYKNNNSL
ncbi:hypothetical protein EHRUM2_02700 [Ehrlichia ruminantium]|uniref:Uncharacterized protein n=1 Tax=Ehrlichia ruminantium TaxID=779 RepID=A0A161LZR6_EHRRU|nr:hypothetical protein EHRUM2_02700 [Ehrlichia ruminantium]